MENQPAAAAAPTNTSRQWFRLASLARLEALGQPPSLGPTAPPNPGPAAPSPNPAPVPGTATPAPTPSPRIPLPLQDQAQPQPQPQPQSPITANGELSSGAKTPPRPPAMNPSQSAPPPPSPRFQVPSRGPTPPESPKIIKQSSTTPPDSPKIQQLKPIKAPPPPYPEPEPTPVPALSPKWNSSSSNGTKVHKAVADINGKPPPPSSTNRNAGHNGTGTVKRDEDGEMKMITMAGANMGAYMELLGSSHKQKNGNHLKQHQTQTSTEDGKSVANKKEEVKAMGTVVNGNVQSVNNSILFGSSCTQQSPGVHIALVSRLQPKHKGAT